MCRKSLIYNSVQPHCTPFVDEDAVGNNRRKASIDVGTLVLAVDSCTCYLPLDRLDKPIIYRSLSL